jgi:hypothetical protein
MRVWIMIALYAITKQPRRVRVGPSRRRAVPWIYRHPGRFVLLLTATFWILGMLYVTAHAAEKSDRYCVTDTETQCWIDRNRQARADMEEKMEPCFVHGTDADCLFAKGWPCLCMKTRGSVPIGSIVRQKN